MIERLRTLFAHRELVWMWMLREIRIRYKQSLLGGAWAILQPLSIMIIFSVIFTYLVRVPTDGVPYPIFSYSALLPWTFFATSVSFGVPSLTQNFNLVTKIYFPREILPLAVVAASGLDFLIGLLVFAGLMFLYRTPVGVPLVLVPALIVLQILLTLGVVLFASAVNVFYRDVRFGIPLVMQLWMYATPIIYPATLIPERFRALYMLNPMAGIVEAYRAIALHGAWPNWGHLGVSAAIAAAVFVGGYAYFAHVEWQFADII